MNDLVMLFVFIIMIKFIVDNIRSLKPPSYEYAGVSFDEDEGVESEPEEAWKEHVYFKKGDVEMPEPDPAIGQAALDNIALGKEAQSFAETQYADAMERQGKLDALTEEVVASQMETQDRTNQWAIEDRSRYQNTFQPIEDQLVKEAMEYDTPEKQAAAAAEAKSSIMTEADTARDISDRRMASYGIKPGSGRWDGVDKAGETALALGSANAQNKARENVRNTGTALRTNVSNMGKGLPGQALSAASLGLNAGSTATGNQSNSQNMSYNAGNIMQQGFQAGMSGNSSGANMLGNLYGQQMSAYNADQEASGAFWSGLGSLAGTLGGAAIVAGTGGAAAPVVASSKDYKEDKQPIEWNAMEKINSMPVESWSYKDGISDGGDHIGPYAEDFHQATGQGDGKSIPLQDMMGLQLKAIQELGIEVAQLKGGNKKPPIEGEFRRVS